MIDRQAAIDAICSVCEARVLCNKNKFVYNALQEKPVIMCSEHYKLTQLPSAEPLTEEDYIELRDRFGEFVEFVVRDMISGKGERWE